VCRRVGDGKVAVGRELRGARDLLGGRPEHLAGALVGGGERERHIVGALAAHEQALGRVALVLRPGLVLRLPGDQAQVAGEADGAVVAVRRRLVEEAGLGERVRQHPLVVHVGPVAEGGAPRRLAAHVALVEVGEARAFRNTHNGDKHKKRIS